MTGNPDLKEAVAKFQEMMSDAGISQKEAAERAAALNEKFSKIVLDAALQSSKTAAAWSEESIAQLSALSKAMSDPAQISRDMADYAKHQAEVTMEKMATFAELAQKVQSETIALYTEASKEAFTDLTAATDQSKKKD